MKDYSYEILDLLKNITGMSRRHWRAKKARSAFTRFHP